MSSSPTRSSVPFKRGCCWVLPVDDTIPTVATLEEIPWKECSTVSIHIRPSYYDSPDPQRGPPMINLDRGEPLMAAVTSRVAIACSFLKALLQEDINAGTMAVQVVFEEC